MDYTPDPAELDDVDDMPVVRRIIPVEQTELSRRAHITSIWDLAFSPLKLRRKFGKGSRHPHYRIEHGEGLTRYRQLEARESQEWREREFQRRARQIVPSPLAMYRTTGAKAPSSQQEAAK